MIVLYYIWRSVYLDDASSLNLEQSLTLKRSLKIGKIQAMYMSGELNNAGLDNEEFDDLSTCCIAREFEPTSTLTVNDLKSVS